MKALPPARPVRSPARRISELVIGAGVLAAQLLWIARSLRRERS